MGCGGRGSVGAMRIRRAVSHRERTTARRTKGASAFAKASADSHLSPATPLGEDGRCVRQNRVVLTPVAGAKMSGGEVSSTGLDQPPIRFSTVTRGIRRRGEHGISRKAIAQGMPECSDCTCMLVCVFCAQFCTRDRGCSVHPAFPAPSHGAKRYGATRTNHAAGMRTCVPTSLRAKRSNPAFSVRRYGLLRFARNDGV
jgi:hypothetical protein